MTKQEMLDNANANGYATAGKRDIDLLNDARFFRAAFAGLPEEVRGKYTQRCGAGCGYLAGTHCWTNCLLEAQDALGSGKTTDETWAILENRVPDLTSTYRNQDGSLDLTKF